MSKFANLVPEQIEILESDPGKLPEILGAQEAPRNRERRNPAADVKNARLSKESDDEGEDKPVVLNKSSKGTVS